MILMGFAIIFLFVFEILLMALLLYDIKINNKDDFSKKQYKRKNEWYSNEINESFNKQIDAQSAIELIFKILINDYDKYQYLIGIADSMNKKNGIMLDIILTKYSRKYMKFKKNNKKIEIENSSLIK